MIFLTQIRLDKREAARLRLADSYAWHQQLWQAFPDRDGQERSFLFRIDDKRHNLRILLLSADKPTEQAWGIWETKMVAQNFLNHERYLFQVRANPTVKRIVRDEAGERKKNGQRTGIYDHQGLRAWMGRKAAQSGFELLECSIAPAIETRFAKEGQRGKHIAVDFHGTIRVTNRVAFQRAFQKGIGPAKAFGFGLLMLQPVA